MIKKFMMVAVASLMLMSCGGNEVDNLISDYEDLCNEVVELQQKMEENPSDLELISEAAELATKAADLAERLKAAEETMTDEQKAKFAEIALKAF
jgi:hypothetical protein